MTLRPYRPGDRDELAQLFYDTVQTVNRRDYTGPQVDAWSAGRDGLTDAFFRSRHTLVADADGQIAGYGNMDASGYLDHLFVHKDFQGRGCASALCDALEARARAQGLRRVTVHASITAKPFFLGRGYALVREQEVRVRGCALTNFVLQKAL